MPVTLADRGRGVGMIVHRDLETDLYKIAVKAGVLNDGCCRNEFDCLPRKCVRRARVYEM